MQKINSVHRKKRLYCVDIGGTCKIERGSRSDSYSCSIRFRFDSRKKGFCKRLQWSTYSSGWGGNVVGIGGYAWGDFMPYVKGGWTWLDQTVTRTQLFGTVGTATVGTAQSVSVYRTGWTIGGGLAYHVWSNWEVFGQYMYADYGNSNIGYSVAQ